MKKPTVFGILAVASLAACSSSSVAPTHFAIAASTDHVTFGITQYLPTPAAVTLTKPDGFSNASVSVNDPTQAGASFSAASGATSGTLTIVPVSLGATGNTDVIVTDGDGSSADVAVTQQVCGRPEAIVSPPPALVIPANGATGISSGVGTMTIAYNSGASFGLHLILGAHATFDVSPAELFIDPGNPGTTGPGGSILSQSTAMIGLPQLPSTTAVRVQYYDDTCEPAWIIGSFTTK